MSKAEKLEEKWDNGCENGCLDPGDVFGDAIEYCHSLENALQEAITGLEWRRVNTPANFSEADEEKLAKWYKILGHE